MDKFKVYLQEHREELDKGIPDSIVWKRIRQQGLHRRYIMKIRSIVLSLTVAASLFILLLNLYPGGAGKMNTGSPAAIVRQCDTAFHGMSFMSGHAEPAKVRREDTIKVTLSKKYALDTIVSAEKASAMVNVLEQNYSEQSRQQLQTIRSTPVFISDPDYFAEFRLQLQKMDRDESQLKIDMKESGINNILLEQLINICQQRLSLLKDLLTEINKVNYQVKQRRPPVDTLKAIYIKI